MSLVRVHISGNPPSLLLLLMMTRLLCVPSDHGRPGRQRPGPRPRLPPSILRGHQDGHGGLHRSVHKNIPEQNLPCVPGQEETQEKRQELVRARRHSVAGSGLREHPPSEARGERDGGEEEIKALSPRCSSVSSLHCAQL